MSSYLERYILIILVSALLLGCANEKYVLHSKLPSDVTGEVRLGAASFPFSNKYGTYFNVNGVQGWLEPGNPMVFDKASSQFLKRTKEPFAISIGFRENKFDAIVISQISGEITLENGLRIQPSNALYQEGVYCYTTKEFSPALLHPKKSIRIPPGKKACLIFEYSEFINPQNKFTFVIGNVERLNAKSILSLSFIPVIMKSSSH
jgi:hypothetical protein